MSAAAAVSAAASAASAASAAASAAAASLYPNHRCRRGLGCLEEVPGFTLPERGEFADASCDGAEKTRFWQVCVPRALIYYGDYGALLQLEQAVGLDRPVALEALRALPADSSGTVADLETMLDFARLLVDNHGFTAAEIEDGLLANAEFDVGDGERAYNLCPLGKQLEIVRAIESKLARPLKPALPAAEPDYYTAGLRGFFAGRADTEAARSR